MAKKDTENEVGGGTTISVTMKQDKVTKNAVRFEEIPPTGEPAKIGTLYVQKFPFGETLPDRITVTVTVTD